ncbi:MAG: hypothetical protein MK033_09045 [Candidatus Caenarcaniphilales bacterium]|nr:hypothetical protein [Candidatus Caenarcaniphilales bacterium]
MSFDVFKYEKGRELNFKRPSYGTKSENESPNINESSDHDNKSSNINGQKTGRKQEIVQEYSKFIVQDTSKVPQLYKDLLSEVDLDKLNKLSEMAKIGEDVGNNFIDIRKLRTEILIDLGFHPTTSSNSFNFMNENLKNYHKPENVALIEGGNNFMNPKAEEYVITKGAKTPKFEYLMTQGEIANFDGGQVDFFITGRDNDDLMLQLQKFNTALRLMDYVEKKNPDINEMQKNYNMDNFLIDSSKHIERNRGDKFSLVSRYYNPNGYNIVFRPDSLYTNGVPLSQYLKKQAARSKLL